MNIQKPASVLTSTLQCIIAGIVSGLLIALLLSLVVILFSNYAAAHTLDEAARLDTVPGLHPGNLLHDILLLMGLTRYMYAAFKKLSVLFLMINLPLCGMWHIGEWAYIHIEAILAHSSLGRFVSTHSRAK